MKNAFITFDLRARTSADYTTAYNLLGEAGFFCAEPHMTTYLPNTTVMGTIDNILTAEDLKNVVRDTFKNHELVLTSILCGIVTDYSGEGKRVGL